MRPGIGAADALTRRELVLGAAAAVAAASPLARGVAARAAGGPRDETLGAFADTIIPGRRIDHTDLGLPIPSRAIVGVDPDPGAVETDAIALYHHRLVGFDLVAGAFLADLETRALRFGAPFVRLDFAHRTKVCVEGLRYGNPTRLLWEAAAAVPFAAFAGALAPAQTATRSGGYRTMGHPGAAPAGYADASYRRVLARERTLTGSLA